MIQVNILSAAKIKNFEIETVQIILKLRVKMSVNVECTMYF